MSEMMIKYHRLPYISNRPKKDLTLTGDNCLENYSNKKKVVELVFKTKNSMEMWWVLLSRGFVTEYSCFIFWDAKIRHSKKHWLQLSLELANILYYNLVKSSVNCQNKHSEKVRLQFSPPLIFLQCNFDELQLKKWVFEVDARPV
jgi:hypothetical protein